MKTTRVAKPGWVTAAALVVWLGTAPLLAVALNPEQTIAQIDEVTNTAENWMWQRSDQYAAYLLTNPAQSAAATERDRAVADIAAKKQETDATVTNLMAQHPGNQDVQEAGNDTLDNVAGTAANATEDVQVDYSMYIAILASTTTTTAPTTTTTAAPTTTLAATTTSNPPPTTTVPVTSTTTPPTTTSTTTPTASSTTTTEPPTASMSSPPDGGSAQLIRSSLLTAAASAPNRSSAPILDGDGGAFDVTPLLAMLRSRLPSAVSEPLIDVLIVIRAIAAAFVSGATVMVWPAGLLATAFGVHLGIRGLRQA